MLRFVSRMMAAGLLMIAGAANAQVVISQVYGGGGNTGAPYRSDFIELHNNGVTSVNLTGWSVQYSSSTGTAWTRTNLTGSIAAGGYFLVKQADGAGTTLPALPTPDVIGTIAMSGTAGKVALANNQTTLTGVCPLGGAVVDFVGFGTATNCSETTPTANLSNTTAAIRNGNGCTDTGNNSTDFAVATANPRNSASPNQSCSVSALPQLSVTDSAIDEGNSGTTPMSFSFTLDTPAGVGGVSINYATVDGTAIAGSDYTGIAAATVVIPEGQSYVNINVDILGDTTAEPDETFTVSILSASGANIVDTAGVGTIRNDDVTLVQISDIQGRSLTSPLVGTIVSTEGIVTALKFNNGFFLQSASDDGNPATSEGIFVFTSTAPTVAVGNRVRVTGTVTEFTPSTDLNQLSITEIVSPTVAVLQTGVALPAPIVLTAADFGSASTPGTAERYEGMRVSVPSARVVEGSDGNITESSATSTTTGVFQVVLATVARPFREPGIGVLDTIPIPGGKNPPRFDTNQERLMVRSRAQVGATAIALDNEAIVDGMVGVLDYFSGTWALLPDPTAAITVTGGKQPTAVTDPAYEDITVGGFNLLRFFDEVNDSNGAPTLTAAALDKRLTKTSTAICDYLKTPDILGVVEVENLRVLGLLADRINANCSRAPSYVPYLVQGNDVGGINVGLLVSTRSLGTVNRVEVVEVTQYGKTTAFTNPDNSTSLLNDRPPLLLRAIVHQDNGASFPITVIVNHMRSLNGVDSTAAGSGGWPTEGDRVRNKRAQQAIFVANLVQSLQVANPNEKIVLLGDFNAFEFSDGYADVLGIIRGNPAAANEVLTYAASPITTPLTDGSLLIFDPAERYSYVFEGSAQTLDHVLVNQALLSSPLNLIVDHPRINSDFGVHNFGVAGNAIRVSDHDPVRLTLSVADFRTANLSVTASVSPSTVAAGGSATFTATVGNAGPSKAAFPSVAFVFDAIVSVAMTTVPANWSCAAPVQAGLTTTVTCSAASIDVNAPVTFNAAVTAPSQSTASTLRMAASVQSQTRDSANGNNSASANVVVQAIPLPNADLSLRLVGGPVGFIRGGYVATFSIPVRNTGPNAVSQPTVTFTGSVQLQDATVTAPAGWACVRDSLANGNFNIVCTLTGSFAVNAKATFAMTVIAPRVQAPSTMTIDVSVGSTTTNDPLTNNNSVNRTLDVIGSQPPPPISTGGG